MSANSLILGSITQSKLEAYVFIALVAIFFITVIVFLIISILSQRKYDTSVLPNIPDFDGTESSDVESEIDEESAFVILNEEDIPLVVNEAVLEETMPRPEPKEEEVVILNPYSEDQ